MFRKDRSFTPQKMFHVLFGVLLVPWLALASPSVDPSPSCDQEGANDRMRKEVLSVHNRYRAELDLPPLVWSETLEAHASAWANFLAQRGGVLCHSQYPGEGENLWKGTANHYSYAQKVEYWASKKKFFKNGVFPHVSKTGSWSDVGHYSQMIWRKTTQVGCAKATTGDQDIFVCRYAPPGNILTRKVDD
jgi:uncharacterized protein YkwD